MADDLLSLHKVAGLGLGPYWRLLTFRAPGSAGLEGDWGNVMEIIRSMFLRHRLVYQMAEPTEKLSHFQTLFAMMLFSIPVLAITALFMEMDYRVRFSLMDSWPSATRALGHSF